MWFRLSNSCCFLAIFTFLFVLWKCFLSNYFVEASWQFLCGFLMCSLNVQWPRFISFLFLKSFVFVVLMWIRKGFFFFVHFVLLMLSFVTILCDGNFLFLVFFFWWYRSQFLLLTFTWKLFYFYFSFCQWDFVIFYFTFFKKIICFSWNFVTVLNRFCCHLCSFFVWEEFSLYCCFLELTIFLFSPEIHLEKMIKFLCNVFYQNDLNYSFFEQN